MGIKVTKFGGSSLCDAKHFKQVAEILRSDNERRFVVPSAPGKRFREDTKVTDMLYECYSKAKAKESIDEIYSQIVARYTSIIDELGLDFDMSGEFLYVKNAILHSSGRDYAASRGEYLNGLILAKYLGYQFIDAENVIFFKENGTFDAEKTNEVLAKELAKCDKAVIPGFYGVMPNGTIKTFSRGGSDITGSIVARACNASLYENWTDVSGFMMADPRIIKDPCHIDTITYRELRELSYMGATVLHEDAIFPVRYAKIPINIRNTNAPEDKGTMIVHESNDYDKDKIITGIAGKKGFSVITIENDMMNSEVGFGRRVLDVLESFEVSWEHLPSGIDTMSIVISTSQLEGKCEKIISALERSVNPDHLSVEHNLSLIAVVGRGMIQAKGTSARVLTAIAESDTNIRMIDQGSSEINIIIGVDEKDFEKSLNAIYNEFVR
ncbi:MAG: aspartate kinase [Ruminococcaceae bacterium]|nr:aspartate kinase [Oscillospiraceae bacterium]